MQASRHDQMFSVEHHVNRRKDNASKHNLGEVHCNPKLPFGLCQHQGGWGYKRDKQGLGRDLCTLVGWADHNDIFMPCALVLARFHEEPA